MIKKKLISSVAVATMITSLFATSAFAADWNTQGGSSTVTGSSSTVEPTIEVEIPGDFEFALNPLKLNVAEEGATKNTEQIVASDYSIINYSNVPVLVTTKTSAKAVDANVVLADDGTRDTTTGELPAVTSKKNAFLCLAVATKAEYKTDHWEFTYGDVNASSGVVKDESSATAQAMKILSTSDTEVKFKLSAASGSNAATEAASFTLRGALDPQASFSEGNITVTTVYNLTVITPDQYTGGYEADTTLTNGANTVTAK